MLHVRRDAVHVVWLRDKHVSVRRPHADALVVQSREDHADNLELAGVGRVDRLHQPRHHVAESRGQLVVVVEEGRRRLAREEWFGFHRAVLERAVRVGRADDGV